MREMKFRIRTEQYGRVHTDIVSIEQLIDGDVLSKDTYPDRKILSWDECTDLKDRNGIEIYERDIVKCDDYDLKWVIHYESKRMQFGLKDTYLNAFPFEIPPYEMYDKLVVIGNIYENPKMRREVDDEERNNT